MKLRAGDVSADVTLAVGPSTGNAPLQEVTFSGSVEIVFDLQAGSNIQFVTRSNAPEAAYIDELATDVWLLGDIKARFRAWAVWQEWYQNGQDNVNVMAVTYKKLLQRRHFHAAQTYTNVDLGNLIWGMWQHTQALPGGDLGVTLGSPITTGLVRTREYKIGENIGNQADHEYEEGMWWQVDENRVYTAGALASRPFIGSPLHLGANIQELQRASGSDYANAVYGDADDEKTTGVWAEAADVATDPRGRWELASGWPTVVLQQTLVDRTNAFLNTSHVSVAHWNLEMVPSRWLTDTKIMPGDHCILVVPRSLAAPIGVASPSIVVQITQVLIQVDASGSVSVKAIAMEHPEIPVPS
jgi:hypothetical protein